MQSLQQQKGQGVDPSVRPTGGGAGQRCSQGGRVESSSCSYNSISLVPPRSSHGTLPEQGVQHSHLGWSNLHIKEREFLAGAFPYDTPSFDIISPSLNEQVQIYWFLH